jgi:hypothetical protein
MLRFRSLFVVLLLAMAAVEIMPLLPQLHSKPALCAHGCTGVCCCSATGAAASCQPAGSARHEVSYSNCGPQQTLAWVKTLQWDRLPPALEQSPFIPACSSFLPCSPSRTLQEFILCPLDPPPRFAC